VTRTPARPSAGFTLLELLIGMSLALMVMGAVLSSYIFLGRNLARLANQQTLETQGRRALAYFAQDVRMASGLTSPSVSGVTLTLPVASVTYTYDSSAHTLTRQVQGATAQILVSNLLSFYFRYYDDTGLPYDNGSSPYTTQTDYLPGIKQVSMFLTSQVGNSGNGTQTPVYQAASSRLIIRNLQLLP
jgi:type II secretory pathway pseudopilin PulG